MTDAQPEAWFGEAHWSWSLAGRRHQPQPGWSSHAAARGRSPTAVHQLPQN